jgi:PKD repeat protein
VALGQMFNGILVMVLAHQLLLIQHILIIKLGTFIVSVNVTSSDGCVNTYTDSITTTNPQPSFVINGPTSSCTNQFVFFTNTSTGATSYWWDFGDPTSSTGFSSLVNPSRNFTTPKAYTISLTATNGACSRTVTYPALIRINRAAPNFSFTQSSQCFPITVTLTDLTGPTPAIQWGWNFYNGSTDSTQNPVYTFNAPPTSDTISLWVRDTNGCSATKRLKGIKYKQAKFTMSATGGCNQVQSVLLMPVIQQLFQGNGILVMVPRQLKLILVIPIQLMVYIL